MVQGCVRSTLANVDALPSKQAGVDRPGAWSEQRKDNTERCQQDVNPRIPLVREEASELENRHERSGNGRPQPDEEEYPEAGFENEQCRRPHCEFSREPGDHTKCQCNGGNQPHDEKPCAWQTRGKCREQPPHTIPLSTVRDSGSVGKPPKGDEINSFE